MEDTPASEIDFARHDRIRPIRWTGQSLELLDQRRLPFEVEYLACANSDEVAAAIHALDVRGAPAIGIDAAGGAAGGGAAPPLEGAGGNHPSMRDQCGPPWPHPPDPLDRAIAGVAGPAPAAVRG